MAVRLEVRDRVGWITFDRPERFNSIDLASIKELHQATKKMASDPEVRCIVLTGAGDSFCSGADLKEVAAHPDPKQWILGATADLHPMLQIMHEGPKPTLTAINGAAAGGGLGIALSGDVRIASEAAKFRSAYARIGLTPDGGATYFVTRYAGLATAQRMFFLDETLDANEAKRLGLVHRVVAPKDLPREAHRAAQLLASWSSRSLGGTKRLIALAWRQAAAQQMDDERQHISEAGGRADGREGIASFVQKRTPTFD